MPQHIETHFPTDDPAAEGHFPGNPIIPGAVLLDRVLTAVTDGARAAAPYEIRSAKFFRVVRPGDRILISWDEAVDGEIRFDCRLPDGGAVVLAGVLRFSP